MGGKGLRAIMRVLKSNEAVKTILNINCININDDEFIDGDRNEIGQSLGADFVGTK